MSVSNRFAFNETQLKQTTPSAPEKGQRQERKVDERIFKPVVKDPKKANDNNPAVYNALIRILPRGLDFSKPCIIDIYEHIVSSSKNNGVGLFCGCRKTLDPTTRDCPVCQENYELFKEFKRTQNPLFKVQSLNLLSQNRHLCNILIVKDAENPQNDGKVKLWNMPESIYKMFLAASSESKQEEKIISPFADVTEQKAIPVFHPQDPVNGRNLILTITRKVDNNVVDYSNSKWFKPEVAAPIASSDEEIEAILKECNDFTEFVSQTPSIEQLNQKLVDFKNKVLSKQGGIPAQGTPNAFTAVGAFENSNQPSEPVLRQPERLEPETFFKAKDPFETAPSIPTTPEVLISQESSSEELPGEDDLPF